MTVLLPLGGPKYLHPAWRSQDAKHYTASLFPHSVAEEFAKAYAEVLGWALGRDKEGQFHGGERARERESDKRALVHSSCSSAVKP